jgi:hypothetical protein
MRSCSEAAAIPPYWLVRPRLIDERLIDERLIDERLMATAGALACEMNPHS